MKIIKCTQCKGFGHVGVTDRICGACKGTGEIEVPHKKISKMIEPGTHITFEPDHGFVLSCFNDSIHMYNELAIEVVKFISENMISDKAIIMVKTLD
jgi:hypothetical protein